MSEDMRNFRILLQYEGTRYRGWQRQESTGDTIQGRLEALLTKMCGQKAGSASFQNDRHHNAGSWFRQNRCRSTCAGTDSKFPCGNGDEL